MEWNQAPQTAFSALLGSGNGEFEEVTDVHLGAIPVRFRLLDIESDGDADAVGMAAFAEWITFLENR